MSDHLQHPGQKKEEKGKCSFKEAPGHKNEKKGEKNGRELL